MNVFRDAVNRTENEELRITLQRAMAIGTPIPGFVCEIQLMPSKADCETLDFRIIKNTVFESQYLKTELNRVVDSGFELIMRCFPDIPLEGDHPETMHIADFIFSIQCGDGGDLLGGAQVFVPDYVHNLPGFNESIEKIMVLTNAVSQGITGILKEE